MSTPTTRFRRLAIALTLVALPSAAGQTATEAAKLTDAAPEVLGYFGSGVAVLGDTAMVGARGDDGDTGAVFVYERNQGGANAWGEVLKLTASDGFAGDKFGLGVQLSGDSAVVLANSGVYVLDRNQGGAGAWGEVAKIAHFGSMDISGDTIVIRDSVYERNLGGANAWGMTATLVPSPISPGANFGAGVAICGDTILVSAVGESTHGSNSGAAFVFERDKGGPGAWGQVVKLTESVPGGFHFYGVGLSIHEDTAVIGTLDEAAYVHERHQGDGWAEVQRLTASDGQSGDNFGRSSAVYADRVVVGAPNDDHGGLTNAGSTYVFERDLGGPNAWGELEKLTASDARDEDQFGSPLALSGCSAVIGSPESDVGAQIRSVQGLALDPGTGTLYGTNEELGELITIDPVTGLGTPVGVIGFSLVRGLAFDPGTNTLYGSDIGTDQLIAIDPLTGAGTAVGALGFSNVRGLAFDPGTSTLYGSDISIDQLITIDTSTGAGTAVGPFGFSVVDSLAFDPGTGTLYGANFGTRQLITIDTSTGAGTAVGPSWPNLVDFHGLAFDPGAGDLYGSDQTAFHSIDPPTGVTSSIGSFTLYEAGAAYVYELSTFIESYCTAGTSASGCQALLSASGTASASAASGFDLMASGVEGSKDGTFFYGTNGRQANGWGSGTSFQCVTPPVRRAGLLAGTGTNGSCDGVFTQDLNALWSAKPAHNPGAGAVVQAQLWYRDPQNTSNQTTGLSDAIEFLVAP